MVNRTVAAALDDLTQTQRERLFYIEVKAFFCGDLTRADIERRFGVKPAASARDLSTYRRLAQQNLFYDAGQRKYATTDRFAPLFEHSAERVLTWFRSGFGDNMDQKLKRTVPCESASDLVKPDIETLATLTRAIAGRRQVKVNYLSLTSGASTKTLCLYTDSQRSILGTSKETLYQIWSTKWTRPLSRLPTSVFLTKFGLTQKSLKM
ncbi:hypothetical protein [Limnohabitans sp. MMS-10A-160]|uniref:hypothetical protein n=1 Tax=Limnohabitans sp. MMS-10A-160 TaxID=1835766 RepID=UPI001E3C7190|nr:hypothetical protein [Limnohabitans sp. MMS-10A-160]